MIIAYVVAGNRVPYSNAVDEGVVCTGTVYFEDSPYWHGNLRGAGKGRMGENPSRKPWSNESSCRRWYLRKRMKKISNGSSLISNLFLRCLLRGRWEVHRRSRPCLGLCRLRRQRLYLRRGQGGVIPQRKVRRSTWTSSTTTEPIEARCASGRPRSKRCMKNSSMCDWTCGGHGWVAGSSGDHQGMILAHEARCHGNHAR